MMEQAEELITALILHGLTISTAESLTGGLVCAELTTVPGSSVCVKGAIVAYDTEIKSSVLSVDPSLLDERGAVDPQVAQEMAEHVARLMSTDIGVATTGVAGPDMQDGKKVGTVHVACWFAEKHHVQSYQFVGTREDIRQQSVVVAIQNVLQIISHNRE